MVFTPTQLIVCAIAVLVCLAPFTFYFFWLAAVNRRSKPVVVDARWDFAGLVAALSGFLMVAGVILLTCIHTDSRLLGNGKLDKLADVFQRQWLAWTIVLVGYLLLLAAGVTAGVLLRRDTLSIYNIGPEALEEVIDDGLHRAGVSAVRRGLTWTVEKPHATVTVSYFYGARHAGVRVRADRDDLKQELERNFRASASAAEGADGPAGGWFRACGSIGVMFLLAVVALILAIQFFR